MPTRWSRSLLPTGVLHGSMAARWPRSLLRTGVLYILKPTARPFAVPRLLLMHGSDGIHITYPFLSAHHRSVHIRSLLLSFLSFTRLWWHRSRSSMPAGRIGAPWSGARGKRCPLQHQLGVCCIDVPWFLMEARVFF